VTDGETDLTSALFLDRDGVLNVYLPGDYVKSPGELRLLAGAGRAVRRANDAQIPVILISNQQGVGKGVMTEADLDAVDQALRAGLHDEANARLTASYYCTHLARDNSPHRKPEPGMILDAARDHRLDLARSVFVGDTETDALAARAAGVGAFVLVLTGKHTDATVAQNRERFPVPPDFVAASLEEAVEWSLRRIVTNKPGL